MTLAAVRASERLKTRAALLITSPDPREPVVPALPTRTVPEVMVVVPEYVLLPFRLRMPWPSLTIEPVPEIALPTLVSEERFQTMRELLVTVAASPMNPAVEPEPSCSVPEETVTEPVSVLLLERTRVPPSTVRPPARVAMPESVNVPFPALVKLPAPERLPERV